MDGVLVNQTSRKRFDLMGWCEGGRELWEAVKWYRPTLLSQLMQDIWEVSRHEKRIWIERELGDEVPYIITHGELGKWRWSRPGHVLIDDSVAHKNPWEKHGGIFILHRNAAETISTLLWHASK